MHTEITDAFRADASVTLKRGQKLFPELLKQWPNNGLENWR